MSKKNSRGRAPQTPTLENPGDLPLEATNGGAESQSPIEKQREKDAAEIFARLRRELGSAGFVTLRRRHPPAGQLSYGNVGEMALGDFTIDNVINLYGGGDFIAQGRANGGTIQAEHRFTIDHTIPPKNPRAGAVEKDKAPQTDVAGIMREFREVLRDAAPKENSSGLVEIVKAALARPEPKSEILAITEMINVMREESRKSEERFLKLLDRMSERAAPVAAPSLKDQLADAMELVEMVRGGDDKPGKSDWRETVAAAAARGIEAAAPLLAKHFAGAAPISTAGRALPAPASIVTAAPASSQPAAAVPGQPAEENAEMNTILQNLGIAQFRDAALKAARQGKEPYEFATDKVGEVPENFRDAMFNVANAPDWFERIFTGAPEATKHLKFLNELRESILCGAFVYHAHRFKAVNKPAKETAEAFLGWVTQELHDGLCGMAEQPDEAWPDVFSDFGLSFELPALDPAWLEQLRAAVLAALGGEETAANVVPMPAGPSAETGAGSSSAPAPQPNPPATSPAPDSARGSAKPRKRAASK